MEERAMVAALSALAVKDGFHPIFVLQDGEIDAHSLWTIEHSTYRDATIFLFANDETANIEGTQMNIINHWPNN